MNLPNSMKLKFSAPQILYFPPPHPCSSPPPFSSSTWGAMKRCSGWADVFLSTIWILSQISSVLMSFTGHGWLRLRGNDKTTETTVRWPSEPSVTCRTVAKQKGLESWMHGLDQCTVHACEIMTDRHGDPGPLLSVRNTRVGPHV